MKWTLYPGNTSLTFALPASRFLARMAALVLIAAASNARATPPVDSILVDGATAVPLAEALVLETRLPFAGWYQLHLHSPSEPANGDEMMLQIETTEGTTAVFVDQNETAGNWRYLGTFSFAESTRVSIAAGDRDQSAAGALRFDYRGDSAPSPVVATASLPTAIAGTDYAVPLGARDGRAPYRWHAPTALPAGITLDTLNGKLRGTPVAPGHYALTILVADAEGNTHQKQLTLEVLAAGSEIASRTATPSANPLVRADG